MEITDEGCLLLILRSEINRLVHLVDTMGEVCKRDRLRDTPSLLEERQ